MSARIVPVLPTHVRHINVRALGPMLWTASGRPCCRWCKTPILTGMKSRRWCSKACLFEFDVRASAGQARHAVFKRDRGVCALCGLDTERITRIVEVLRWRARSYFRAGQWGRDFQPNVDLHAARWERAQAHLAKILNGRWSVGSHLWEADHIIPVSEGGGACGLENLRTLCMKCHGGESGALRKRLNAAKRAVAEPPLPGVRS